MNLEEIKKGAPVGATHYEIEDGYIFYWKLTSGGYAFYNDWFDVWYIENTQDKEIKPLP